MPAFVFTPPATPNPKLTEPPEETAAPSLLLVSAGYVTPPIVKALAAYGYTVGLPPLM